MVRCCTTKPNTKGECRIVLQRPAVRRPERAQQERDQWGEQQYRHQGDVAPDEQLFTRRFRRPRDRLRGLQIGVALGLQSRVDQHEREHQRQLKDRQRGGELQIEQAVGLTVDFDFQRGEANAAQDQHDAERGEAEDENQR